MKLYHLRALSCSPRSRALSRAKAEIKHCLYVVRPEEQSVEPRDLLELGNEAAADRKPLKELE